MFMILHLTLASAVVLIHEEIDQTACKLIGRYPSDGKLNLDSSRNTLELLNGEKRTCPHAWGKGLWKTYVRSKQFDRTPEYYDADLQYEYYLCAPTSECHFFLPSTPERQSRRIPGHPGRYLDPHMIPYHLSHALESEDLGGNSVSDGSSSCFVSQGCHVDSAWLKCARSSFRCGGRWVLSRDSRDTHRFECKGDALAEVGCVVARQR